MAFKDAPSHWRNRAEEARLRAEQMSDARARETMLGIAREYERFAEIAMQRLQKENDNKASTNVD